MVTAADPAAAIGALQARNWRLMAFGTSSSGALIWQSLQSRVTPYVVEAIASVKPGR